MAKNELEDRKVMDARRFAANCAKPMPVKEGFSDLVPGLYPKEVLSNVEGFGYKFLMVDSTFLSHKTLCWVSCFIEKTDIMPFVVECVGASKQKGISCKLPELKWIIMHLQATRDYWQDSYCPRVSVILRLYDEFLARLDDMREGDFERHVRQRSSLWVTYNPELQEKHRKVNDFVGALRKELRSSAFKAKEKSWRGKVNVRLKSASGYLDKIFAAYSRLMVVRVDLYPKKFDAKLLMEKREKPVQATNADLKKIIMDVERLLNNRRHNKLFEHCVGYIVKIEYGRDRGWHAHAIFLYDGHHVQNDSYYSSKIGDYWSDVVTNGGTFWACNRTQNKSRYPVEGIGMIDHLDGDKRRALIDVVVAYLAKSDLYVQSKSFDGQKLFRMGRPPTVPEVKLGRPRLTIDPSQHTQLS